MAERRTLTITHGQWTFIWLPGQLSASQAREAEGVTLLALAELVR